MAAPADDYTGGAAVENGAGPAAGSSRNEDSGRSKAVVVRDRRHRVEGVGWCWATHLGSRMIEVLVPDAVLRSLAAAGRSPFSGDAASVEGFFDAMERACGRAIDAGASSQHLTLEQDEFDRA